MKRKLLMPAQASSTAVAVGLILAATVGSIADAKPVAPQGAAKVKVYKHLRIAEGALPAAPDGQEVTMTVNGVETAIAPGDYDGNVALTTTERNIVDYTFATTTIRHDFRQALYLDETGIVRSKSVLSAAGNYRLQGGVLSGAVIRSNGENFNGIYVAGGNYTISNPVVDFVGNGGNDFAGFGAGIMSTGKDTRLVVDGATIRTRGAVRSAIVATNGSNLIVKNSAIKARDGTLPADYVPNVDPGRMKSVPWMLGLSGNNRATNLLGDHTHATYINTSIAAENWGVLSNDISLKPTLTAINSKIAITGKNGYGAYSLGGATTSFFGTEFNVRDYAVIVEAGGSVVTFGASRPDVVADLNSKLDLGLTVAELRALPRKQTVVNSGRFGAMLLASPVAPPSMMAAPPPAISIVDDTVFNTGRAVFIDKGLMGTIFVDGSMGAQLNSRSGVIVQLMDTDDPGVVMVGGAMLNRGVFHEPKGPPARVEGFNPGLAQASDLHVTMANIDLRGDFFNGYRNGLSGFSGGAKASGKNLVLTLFNVNLTGMVTSSQIAHAKDTIGENDYQLLGEVTNTPGAAINNGVILTLIDSNWHPTDTSYVNSLTIDAKSSISAANGGPVRITVNGKPVPNGPGVYTGDIVIAPGI